MLQASLRNSRRSQAKAIAEAIHAETAEQEIEEAGHSSRYGHLIVEGQPCCSKLVLIKLDSKTLPPAAPQMSWLGWNREYHRDS